MELVEETSYACRRAHRLAPYLDDVKGALEWATSVQQAAREEQRRNEQDEAERNRRYQEERRRQEETRRQQEQQRRHHHHHHHGGGGGRDHQRQDWASINPQEARALKQLGLQRGASFREIKQGYHKLALKHHPDKVQGDQAKRKAEDQFRAIADA
eukprot:CAMPEP_0175900412 /NCGR_PEP_ID=MMETSP0108-20121206/2321_1 /TAXON_ID=195067 ORGANISM="Goniomonas pacifica, Strain CCMP1869" /NCGR_SAMPLE_ID=MMETSP0108 /ASSEMBLY_ACC=CAM_ASM_000204 /LENGTH=155 /DNA_ID=CAMNT_0017221939 /DNA_START=180 /DNA_END=643 /DNA_ORIENTATION=-